MVIRPARDGDASEITAVLVAAGTTAWGRWLGMDTVSEANHGVVHPADLVAVDEEGVCGFVAWDARTGEITRLYVHPRAWNSGTGGRLLEEALSALSAVGVRQAWLHTEERNTQPRRFYERRGWLLDGDTRERVWQGHALREVRYVRDLDNLSP